jgi:hypothetical protein
MAYVSRWGAGNVLCFAIGSAGAGVGGAAKYKSKQVKETDDEIGLLSTKADIEAFRQWSQRLSYSWHGSIEVSGKVGKKSDVVRELRRFLDECKKQGKIPQIYFSGHGDESTGDWIFPDGNISFDDVENHNHAISGPMVVNVISDCCFSGKWVQKSAKKTKMNVLASCGPHDTAINLIFSQAFFGGSSEHKAVLTDLNACYTMFDGSKCKQFAF